MKVFVVIPARGGSKGLPGKNIKILNGKPLIQYTIDAASGVYENDQILVSTDSKKIKNTVEISGLKVPFLRPKDLASDIASTHDVLMHAIEYYEKYNGEQDVLLLLQPTSPLRTSFHIKEALKLYHDGIDMVVSVCESDSNPYYTLFEENEEGFLIKSKKGNFTRRQDCPKVWQYNGAIYILNLKSLKKKSVQEFEHIVKYEMDKKSSIDIDDIYDFRFAEMILNEK